MSFRPRVLLALPYYRGGNHGVFLGVAGLARALVKSGAEVAIFDEDLASYAADRDGTSCEEMLSSVLRSLEPTLIGLHVNTPNYAAALALAKKLRSLSEAPIVAGGPHASVAATSILSRHQEFSFVLRGEADVSLPALAWTIASPAAATETIGGLSFRSGDQVRHNPPAPLLSPEEFPTPDRSLFLSQPEVSLRRHAREFYGRNFGNAMPGFEGRRVTGGYVSRGCSGSCPFCSPSAFWADPVSGRPVRRIRPVGAVLAEMAEVLDQGYQAVFFDEPTFPLSTEPAWVRSFAEGMRELGLLWGAPTRLEELQPDILGLLASCGLRYVYFGLESPHSAIRSAMKKPADVTLVRRVLGACEEHGIQCDLSFFFGGPGESDSTVESAIEWVLDNLPSGNAFFSLAAFWPGTRWSNERGLSPECWEPDFDRSRALELGAVWYPESTVSIDRFFSNSTGTYHPAWLTEERALRIKQRIIDSGFRERFSRDSRRGAFLVGES